MTKLKIIMNLQKASLFLSVVACALSIFALISVNKMQIFINNNEVINSRFKPIKDIPDVEIIKPDGTVEKISARKSQDELSKILGNKNSKNEIKLNKDVKEVKKNSNNKDKKPIEPVSREKQNVVKTKEVVKETTVVKQDTQQPVKPNTESVNTEKIHGNFVVQIGAFKDRAIALSQCNKIKQHLNGKYCNVATSNNLVFRSIIYPFVSNDEALKFVSDFSQKTKINCLVKKNG